MSEALDQGQMILAQRCLLCEQRFPAEQKLKWCPTDGSLLMPDFVDPTIGMVLDQKFEILEFLGSGGWSKVYKAKHLHMNKVVAVKILGSSLLNDAVKIDRFQQEAKATNKLVHPNIITVYDHGVLPQPYIVMEFIEGKTLDQYVQENGLMSLELFQKTMDEVCQAMAEAHRSGLIHRDLKPSNVMLTEPTNKAKILDFGLAKLMGQDRTRTGETVGSPPYMSPEQCSGDELDARSDIYSLGCIMYEILTGVQPFVGESVVDCMYKHFNVTPAPISSLRPDLPKALDYVVQRALADKDARYKSMDALRVDLDKACSGTLRPPFFKVLMPRYRQTVYAAARIASIGNWVILIAAALIQITLMGR